eukprot:scaffold71434_cov79-Phaeocystis_antarctica.AAC.2
MLERSAETASPGTKGVKNSLGYGTRRRACGRALSHVYSASSPQFAKRGASFVVTSHLAVKLPTRNPPSIMCDLLQQTRLSVKHALHSLALVEHKIYLGPI